MKQLELEGQKKLYNKSTKKLSKPRYAAPPSLGSERKKESIKNLKNEKSSENLTLKRQIKELIKMN